jgi:hypothetical protein
VCKGSSIADAPSPLFGRKVFPSYPPREETYISTIIIRLMPAVFIVFIPCDLIGVILHFPWLVVRWSGLTEPGGVRPYFGVFSPRCLPLPCDSSFGLLHVSSQAWTLTPVPFFLDSGVPLLDGYLFGPNLFPTVVFSPLLS